MINLGDEIPNFRLRTTVGDMNFHAWLNNSWAILLSHPADFTPVCTTELGQIVKMKEEFDKRGVKIIALSCDDLNSHKEWIKDIYSYIGQEESEFPFPIIADEERDIATELGMFDPDMKDKEGLPLTCRSVFIIGPDRRLKLSILYPATTGRSIKEILRTVDSLKLNAEKLVATPVDWKEGEDCILMPNIKKEDEALLFPKGVRIHPVASKKPYLRFTPQP